MKIVYAREFAKEFKKLPVSVQRLYRKQEEIFKENWRDPRLKITNQRDGDYIVCESYPDGAGRPDRGGVHQRREGDREKLLP